jgi:hypothetical protein
MLAEANVELATIELAISHETNTLIVFQRLRLMFKKQNKAGIIFVTWLNVTC